MSKKSKKEKRKKRSTAENARRRAETHKSGFTPTAFELPEGKSLFALKGDKGVRIDIIPYVAGDGNPFADKGELHYERTFWVHRGIGADQTNYVCLRKTNDEPCPICEFRAKLMKDPDANEDQIKDLAPKERQLFNVINTKEREKGVQLWEMSYHLFGKRLDQEIKNADEGDGYENFAELEGGLTLKLGVEEKSFSGNSFSEVVSINFKPRDKDYDDDILEEAACLDDILILKPYDELKEIFLQTADDDDDEEEDKKATKKSQSKKSKKSKKKKDDDEEDEEEESEDEEETDDDEDEEGEDDEEEDEDEEDEDEEDEDKEDEDKEDEETEENDEDDEDEEEKTKKTKKADKSKSKTKTKTKSKKDKKSEKKKGKGKKGKKNKCPGGGTFGKDTDNLKECTDCPIWDECDDASED